MSDAAEARPRVLIVEDEQIVAADLERSLRSLGYDVLPLAETGRSAVRLAEHERPDLILMDIQLKGKIDGITAADEIVKRWKIPVVFLTANTNDEVALRAKATGPYGYLVKPFRVQELNATMLLALQQHRRAQELFLEHAWLHTLLDGISDGVIAIDAQARVRYLNPVAEQLTGWSICEAKGKPLRDVFVLTTLAGEPVTQCKLERALADSGPANKERFLLLNRDGRCTPIEDSASPILEAGRTTGAVSVFRDITDLLRREREAAERREQLEDEVQLTKSALGQTRAELRALSGHLMTAQEEERGRIARDLHDDFGQRTGLLEIEADQLANLPPGSDEAQQALQRMRAHIRALSEGLRQMSHALHPSILDDLGLAPGLRSLVDEFQQNGLDITFRAVAVPAALPIEIATALYRITQEALRNVLKYCRDAAVWVSLTHKDDGLQLAIEDSGPGFDLTQARAKGGLGLLSMQERAHAVGGNMLVRTAPGKGTQIIIRVPLLSPIVSPDN